MQNAAPTWDRELKQHTCCGSRHTYHRSDCPNRGRAVIGRISDPDFINVQACKSDDLTSEQCAKALNMPLDQVNDLWVL